MPSYSGSQSQVSHSPSSDIPLGHQYFVPSNALPYIPMAQNGQCPSSQDHSELPQEANSSQSPLPGPMSLPLWMPGQHVGGVLASQPTLTVSTPSAIALPTEPATGNAAQKRKANQIDAGEERPKVDSRPHKTKKPRVRGPKNNSSSKLAISTPSSSTSSEPNSPPGGKWTLYDLLACPIEQADGFEMNREDMRHSSKPGFVPVVPAKGNSLVGAVMPQEYALRVTSGRYKGKESLGIPLDYCILCGCDQQNLQRHLLGTAQHGFWWYLHIASISGRDLVMAMQILLAEAHHDQEVWVGAEKTEADDFIVHFNTLDRKVDNYTNQQHPALFAQLLLWRNQQLLKCCIKRKAPTDDNGRICVKILRLDTELRDARNAATKQTNIAAKLAAKQGLE